MSNDKRPVVKIDRRLEGKAIRVGERIVQPVGRLTGGQIGAGSEGGGGAGVVTKLVPLEIVVREGGDEYTISMEEPDQKPLQGILMAGAAVSVGCVLVMMAVHRLAKRSAKS